MRQRMGMVLAAGILAAWAATASGYPVTFEFGGTMAEVFDPDNAFAGRINVGDAFAGSFTFDSTLEDLVSGSDFGSWKVDSGALAVTGEAWEFVSNASNWLSIENRIYDQLSFGGYDFVQQDLHIEGMSAFFRDHSASVFSSDALPLSAPPLITFDEVFFDMEGHLVSDPTVRFSFRGDITYFVPEPTTILLAMLAMGAVASRRRRVA